MTLENQQSEVRVFEASKKMKKLCRDEERHHTDTQSNLKIKGYFDPTIISYRFAKFYFGINCVWQELTEPKGLIKIPLPFATRNYSFIRYKKFIHPTHRTMIEYRLDKKIEALENLPCTNNTEKLMRDSYVRILKHIRGDIE